MPVVVSISCFAWTLMIVVLVSKVVVAKRLREDHRNDHDQRNDHHYQVDAQMLVSTTRRRRRKQAAHVHVRPRKLAFLLARVTFWIAVII